MPVPAELISTLVAGLQLLINNIAKKTGIPTSYIVIATTLLVGVGYTIFKTYLPVGMQEEVLAFTTRTFATQWLIYEALLKDKQK